ncbi:MAG TPA: MFS transporter [Chitinophaga sp.]|uniref:MFS transporter n=1 Tax=Chitinophaga sp. TaxID=1869181 RepID=UPI002DBDE545|nr:MFS transporter [Chitinophaga sp.]HEU4552512.1 MFS transporter [Chitinophaga sp.]
MYLRPKETLTDQEVQRGLQLVIGDGLAAEAMTTFTGGAFLVAMALLLGATNFQIGLLAGIPTFTNLFQLLSIWLVRRYNNRRAIAVLCSVLARFPLLIVGTLVLVFATDMSINVIIFFLVFYYFFGSVAGPSWNSWIKDLVPEASMGAYFSRRSSYTQTLNVVLSFSVALAVDYIKKHYPAYELFTYAILFIAGGTIGIIGAFILSMAPERQSFLARENIFRLLKRPLQDSNFRSLLIFNSAWVFALNIATPFFTVFMLKGLGLSLSYIIALSILSQLSSILTIRVWGLFADRYSNKTIIFISAPLYILTIFAWCFVGIYTRQYANLILLAIIHIFTGISTAGVNLSLTNIGLKLAPSEDAVVYLSTKNIITAFFSSIAPLIGGSLADFFTKRHLVVDATWVGPHKQKTLHLVALHDWNFLFLIGALLAILALELLNLVREKGEVDKNVVVRIMRSSIKSNLKDYFLIGNLINWGEHLRQVIRRRVPGGERG